MKKLILFAFFYIFLTQMATAGNAYVRCVQNQLTALDFAPGPLDGQLGGRTRSALSKFAAKNESFSDIPNISARYAIIWCRRIAGLNEGLQKYMPSFGATVFFVAEQSGGFLEKTLRQSLVNVRHYFKEEFDIILASKIDIVASNNVNKVVRLLRSAQRNNRYPQTSKHTIKKLCAHRDRLDAFASKDEITFCFSKKKVFNSVWMQQIKRYLSFVMTHEYFHHIQRELAADKHTRYVKKGHRLKRITGPAWLVEGSADFFGYLFLKDNFNYKRLLYKGFKNALPYKRTLSQIAEERRLTSTEDYRVSAFAVDLLARRYGVGALISYWEGLGLGQTQEESFRAVFGMSLSGYAKEFEKMRKNFVLSHRFANPS